MTKNQRQIVPAGFLASSIVAFSPVVRFFQKLGLARLLDRIAIALVQLYQRFLSPYKGFCCAYKAVRGENSCSQYFHTVVREEGLAAAIPKFQQRLLECKQANFPIETKYSSNRNKKNQLCDCDNCDSPLPCDGDSEFDCGGCDMSDCG